MEYWSLIWLKCSRIPWLFCNQRSGHRRRSLFCCWRKNICDLPFSVKWTRPIVLPHIIIDYQPHLRAQLNKRLISERNACVAFFRGHLQFKKALWFALRYESTILRTLFQHGSVHGRVDRLTKRTAISACWDRCAMGALETRGSVDCLLRNFLML